MGAYTQVALEQLRSIFAGRSSTDRHDSVGVEPGHEYRPVVFTGHFFAKAAEDGAKID